jgi:Tfp pilus assembly protein PilX
MNTMIAPMKKESWKAQRGVALLIAIFALLLIGGVATSMIVMSRTESAVTGNYRSSTQAFYAAYAGLEEGRGRMRPGHAQTLDAVTGINKGAGVMAANRVVYITNLAAGELPPTNQAANNPYADKQYAKEFPGVAPVVTTVNSSSAVFGGVPGMMFKWVRITPKTEGSANMDVDGNGAINPAAVVFYDGKNQNTTGAGRQVLRATVLAVTPDGSRRMAQYDISPVTLNLQLPAALTFDGKGAALFPANSNVYVVDGNDHAGCGSPATAAPRPAIGVLSPADDAAITAAIPPNRLNKYIGSGPSPDVQDISSSLSKNLSDPFELEQLLQTIKDNTTTPPLKGPITGVCATVPPVPGCLPQAAVGTLANPAITYVDGNLDLSGSITGHGVLVVTGKFTANGTVGWKGIVLVVGQGVMEVNGGGNNQYDGAVLLAKTKDASGNLLPSVGPTLLDWAGGGGNGVSYSTGCINNAQNNTSYRVLSFREIQE